MRGWMRSVSGSRKFGPVDAESPSVVSVRPVAWPKPRTKIADLVHGGFLSDTNKEQMAIQDCEEFP